MTIHSLDGSDIEGYAVDLYKQWGIGAKSTNRGVLILLAVDDHRYRVEVGYGLEPILPDGKVGGFGREAVPYLRQNQYGPALQVLTQRVAETIADDAKVTLDVQSARPPPRARRSNFNNIKLIFFLLFFLGPFLLRMLFSRRGGGGGGGWWVGGFGGGSDSSWGGGGGFGGGSDFGGFGGGSSGGGGASGDW